MQPDRQRYTLMIINKSTINCKNYQVTIKSISLLRCRNRFSFSPGFSLKRYISYINMSPPSGNFTHNRIQNFSIFFFLFGQNIGDQYSYMLHSISHLH